MLLQMRQNQNKRGSSCLSFLLSLLYFSLGNQLPSQCNKFLLIHFHIQMCLVWSKTKSALWTSYLNWCIGWNWVNKFKIQSKNFLMLEWHSCVIKDAISLLYGNSKAEETVAWLISSVESIFKVITRIEPTFNNKTTIRTSNQNFLSILFEIENNNKDNQWSKTKRQGINFSSVVL